MRKLLFPALVLAALATGLLLYSNAGTRKTLTPPVTFVTIKGEKITTAELRGKVVLVNFWATDCAVCIKEMPDITATYRRYQARGFETIAVAMRHDPPNLVLAYAEKNALPFKVAFDPVGELAKAFGDVKLTPTTFIIDKRGYIMEKIQGEPDFPKLQKLLEQKLAEAA